MPALRSGSRIKMADPQNTVHGNDSKIFSQSVGTALPPKPADFSWAETNGFGMAGTAAQKPKPMASAMPDRDHSGVLRPVPVFDGSTARVDSQSRPVRRVVPSFKTAGAFGGAPVGSIAIRGKEQQKHRQYFFRDILTSRAAHVKQRSKHWGRGFSMPLRALAGIYHDYKASFPAQLLEEANHARHGAGRSTPMDCQNVGTAHQFGTVGSMSRTRVFLEARTRRGAAVQRYRPSAFGAQLVKRGQGVWALDGLTCAEELE
ncbi:hypothetical protein B0H14DRAFT_2592132 [Mycena olivaceomarginata]|nr:hypothetical protein B0H14DRAFT_2592132 [Mycena olivaceomarginata]